MTSKPFKKEKWPKKNECISKNTQEVHKIKKKFEKCKLVIRILDSYIFDFRNSF